LGQLGGRAALRFDGLTHLVALDLLTSLTEVGGGLRFASDLHGLFEGGGAQRVVLGNTLRHFGQTLLDLLQTAGELLLAAGQLLEFGALVSIERFGAARQGITSQLGSGFGHLFLLFAQFGQGAGGAPARVPLTEIGYDLFERRDYFLLLLAGIGQVLGGFRVGR
jgi:hypothetical protein